MMVKTFSCFVIAAACLLPGSTTGTATDRQLFPELSRYVALEEIPCPADEVEEVKATGLDMICASTELRFKDFRKQWKQALKHLDLVDELDGASWEKIKNGGRKQNFWMQDRVAVILVNQEQIRFLSRPGLEPCGPDSPYDPPDESVVLPQWKKSAMTLWEGLPLPTYDGIEVLVRARIREDGSADAVCLYDPLPENRYFNAAALKILQWTRFEPAERGGSPLPWTVDVEIQFPHQEVNGPFVITDNPPNWIIRSISPVPQP